MIELKDKPDAPAPGGALAHIAEPLRPLAVPVESLNLDPANARTHPEKNLAAIRASLSRFGQRQPLVVQREGMIVRAGNGRLMAAKAMGWSHVAAIVVDESAIDATAFAIADNRTSDLAEWDDGTLARLLESLPSDLKEAAGYDDKDMKELLASLGGDVVEDEVPEPLPEPVSRRGDLWVMGGHRILCGDSTDGGDVALCLGGETPFLMVTDPPYGVEYDPNWRPAAARTDYMESTKDVDRSWSKVWPHFTGDVAYIWHSDKQRVPLQSAMESLGFELRCELIWMKDVWPMGRGHWKCRHEPCVYMVRSGTAVKWNDNATDAYDDTTIINARPPGAAFGRKAGDDEREAGLTSHACQKPLACKAKLISRHGGGEDSIYEPFSGSGTTIIAADQLGRRCFAIEIEPRYVDVAVRRWQKLTAKDATHADTGKTWADTAAERGVKWES